MKYCEKCKLIFYDNKKLCESCSDKLRQVSNDDLVLMLSVGAIEKERVKIVLEDNSIFSADEKKRGRYDIFVKYRDYDKATDLLMKIDALPSDFKKMKTEPIEASEPEQTVDDTDADTEETEKENDTENTENLPKDADDDKKKSDTAGKNEKKEKLSTEDNEKTVYELFGFQNLSRGKRMATGAILWILFAVVIFLIIAGVDIGVDFIKGLFE